MSPEDEKIIIQYFHEIPNQAAAIIALCCYAFITLAVTAITIKTRAWFMLIVSLTGVLETIGFLARLMMLHNPTRNIFVVHQCLIIISPVLLAIVVYMVLGKLLQRSKAGAEITQSWFARWLSKLYTASDILCLVIQGSAGAMMSADDPSTIKLGTNLMLVGLSLQLAFFSTFTALVIWAHRSPKFGLGDDSSLNKVFICLYSTIVLMFIRNIFRVAEFAQGFDGYLASHEIFFYLLDFVPIFFCFVFFTVLHFGFYLGPNAATTHGQMEAINRDDSQAAKPISNAHGSTPLATAV